MGFLIWLMGCLSNRLVPEREGSTHFEKLHSPTHNGQSERREERTGPDLFWYNFLWEERMRRKSDKKWQDRSTVSNHYGHSDRHSGLVSSEQWTEISDLWIMVITSHINTFYIYAMQLCIVELLAENSVHAEDTIFNSTLEVFHEFHTYCTVYNYIVVTLDSLMVRSHHMG